MIPLDDVGLVAAEPEQHTCRPQAREVSRLLGTPVNPHCDTCHVDGLLIRYSEALRFGSYAVGLDDPRQLLRDFDVIMRSAGARTVCYCGCGGTGAG